MSWKPLVALFAFVALSAACAADDSGVTTVDDALTGPFSSSPLTSASR
jgi:hypothetical protein